MKKKRNISMKKFIKIGSVAAMISLPIIGVVSCGDSSSKVTTPTTTTPTTTLQENKDGKIAPDKNGLFSLPLKDTQVEKFGIRNWKNSAGMLSDNNNKQENSGRINSGQTYAPHFDVSDILEWEASNEDDGYYNKSFVSKRNRKNVLEAKSINGRINENVRYYSLENFRKNTSNSKTGTLWSRDDNNQEITDGSQYITDYIYFGGSVGEGVVYIPRAQDIDSLHRQGVGVQAGIFLAPTAFGGSPKLYEPLLKDIDKASDKLVEMALYYGFDGWFWNIEVELPMGTQQKWLQFMSMLKTKLAANNLENTIYTGSGMAPYSGVSEMLKDPNKYMDVYFNDYYKSGGGISPTGLKKNQSPEGHFPSTPSIDDWSRVLLNKWREGASSFWTFVPQHSLHHWMTDITTQQILNGKSNGQVINDPRNAVDGSMAYSLMPKTSLLEHKSFSTSFNKGYGSKYFVDGKPLKGETISQGFKNLALQQFQPTWRYLVSELDTNMNENISTDTLSVMQNVDSEKAWFGSATMEYSGKIPAGKTITNKLYASEIDLEAGDSFTIKYLSDSTASSLTPNIVVYTWESNKTVPNVIDGTVNDAGAGWKSVTYDLSLLRGKKMSSFGVAFKNSTGNDLTITKLSIGEIGFSTGNEQNTTDIPKWVKNSGEWSILEGKNLRLEWAPIADVIQYMVYSVNSDGTKEIVDITNNPSSFIKGLSLKSVLLKFEVVPIFENNKPGKAFAISVASGKVDISDISKFTHKTLKQESIYGFQSGHGIPYVFSDGKDGYYIFDDQVNAMHVFSDGSIVKLDPLVFIGKIRNDGDTFAAAFTDSNGNVWAASKKVGTAGGENSLFVYDKNINRLESYKSIWEQQLFSTADQSAVKIFEYKKHVFVISNLGEVIKFKLDGTKVQLPLTQYGVNPIVLVSNDKLSLVFQKNEKNAQGQDVIVSKAYNLTSNIPSEINDIFKDVSGKIIATRDLGDEIMFVTTAAKIYYFNKASNDIKKIINIDSSKISVQYWSTSTVEPDAITISLDGKYIYMRDRGARTWIQPWRAGYAKAMSKINIINLSDPQNIKYSKSLPLKFAETQNSAGNINMWSGKFTNFKMIGKDTILYTTRNFGRIGVIHVDRNQITEFENKMNTDFKDKNGDELLKLNVIFSLKSMYKLQYYYRLNNGNKTKMAEYDMLVKIDKNITDKPHF